MRDMTLPARLTVRLSEDVARPSGAMQMRLAQP
jgi:hypothetical protein